MINKGDENEQIPCKKEDGWVEIELGKFSNGVCDDDDDDHDHDGENELEGGEIEVRPKHW